MTTNRNSNRPGYDAQGRYTGIDPFAPRETISYGEPFADERGAMWHTVTEHDAAGRETDRYVSRAGVQL